MEEKISVLPNIEDDRSIFCLMSNSKHGKIVRT